MGEGDEVRVKVRTCRAGEVNRKRKTKNGTKNIQTTEQDAFQRLAFVQQTKHTIATRNGNYLR